MLSMAFAVIMTASWRRHADCLKEETCVRISASQDDLVRLWCYWLSSVLRQDVALRKLKDYWYILRGKAVYEAVCYCDRLSIIAKITSSLTGNSSPRICFVYSCMCCRTLKYMGVLLILSLRPTTLSSGFALKLVACWRKNKPSFKCNINQSSTRITEEKSSNMFQPDGDNTRWIRSLSFLRTGNEADKSKRVVSLFSRHASNQTHVLRYSRWLLEPMQGWEAQVYCRMVATNRGPQKDKYVLFAHPVWKWHIVHFAIHSLTLTAEFCYPFLLPEDGRYNSCKNCQANSEGMSW